MLVPHRDTKSYTLILYELHLFNASNRHAAYPKVPPTSHSISLEKHKSRKGNKGKRVSDGEDAE